MPQDQILKVWGELACFTRPELKVERFSYPVITPSAARGIYDAIYCQPAEFRWQLTRIEVLAYPRYIALRRNEVKDKAPSSMIILRWMEGKEEVKPIFADDNPPDDTKGRTQRQTMALKNVCYRLHAYIRPWPGLEARLPALEAQFRRRASQGKCIYQPYLGCREFPAYFELVEPGAQMETPPPIDLDIGLMLYDVFDLSRPGKPLDTANDELPSISLFRAEVRNGTVTVPDYESDAVLKGRRVANA
ncbi:CRISPR-associated protein Cas5d [Candidatus Hakubella thermalkaliphila]|uniref:pre-crRNA processing endonuclease n=1 Tax=Candidatus Hakubella thermalkaliphila TaxID=2754717 RepID=A0A6V8QAG3_9ACTN|nr:type I-C CRISPR-associated protein Cas5c [Candidatus Hakubella thermalkaliphila]GFP21259.1 CRISPR-associated protein Cas5d [Candidatus Hakubella thermalkaliphila]GFP41593.1 CRISPR-associated protein Cas5d [Candidatus Hakubella thermalkaliphila]